jgi:hypothetical protein
VVAVSSPEISLSDSWRPDSERETWPQKPRSKQKKSASSESGQGLEFASTQSQSH